MEPNERQELAVLRERLAAEERITALARRFLSLEADELDAEIDGALAAVGHEVGADRVRLLALRADREVLALHQWHADGRRDSPPVALGRDAEAFPWIRARLAEGEPVLVADPEALPPEAAEERDAFRGDGVRCHLAIPLRIPRARFGLLDLSCMRSPGRFDEATVARLRLLAELFASTLRRKLAESERDRIQRDLERQLELESHIAELSRSFLSSETTDVESGIPACLASTAALVGAERAWLLSLDLEGRKFVGRYEWCAPGIPQFAQRWARPEESAGAAWFGQRLERGEVVAIESLDDLPPEAHEARADMESRGVRSHLGLPLLAGDSLIGFFGLETFSAPRRWHEATIAPLRLLGELLSGALRRKRTREELRESQRLLAHSQRMEAMGQLAGGVAHDFNNLLVVIGGCAEHLAEMVRDDDARVEVNEIRAAGESAANLTRQLLAFGRRQLLEPRVLDPNGVLRELTPMLRRLIGEDVDLSVETGTRVPRVRADRHQLEQVLVNLAVNARDAMPEGGRLTIAASRREIETDGVPDVPRGTYAEIRVSDDGIGMDEGVRTRVFEPYFTTKAAGRGTGLGLAIVYGIVRQAGGAVQVASEPHKGTTFSVLLPECQEPATGTRSRAAAARESGNETVLLVEDEAPVRRLLRRTLAAAGYEVLEAADGEQALALFAEHGTRIDLLLTDLVMPRMGGSELARRLSAGHPGLRVLMMSGYVDERVTDPARGIRAARMLQKPFDLSTLRTEVRRTLDDAGDPEAGGERDPERS